MTIELNNPPNCSIPCLLIRYVHISHNTPFLPPKILHNLCFLFLLGVTAVQEKLKTMLMQNFGEQTGCILGDMQVANTASTEQLEVTVIALKFLFLRASQIKLLDLQRLASVLLYSNWSGRPKN